MISKPNACRARYALILLAGWGSCLLVSWAQAQGGATVVARDPLVERELLQNHLLELEATHGRHDPILVEPLSTLAISSNQLGLYAEASSLLERALQIQRLNLGLFTSEQVPLHLHRMEIDRLAGDWGAVNESIDYLHWLLLKKNVIEGEILVDSLIRLAETHLQGVTNDAADQQARHYRQAFEMTYEALRIGEEFWEKSEPRRVNLYYSLVKQNFLQSVAVERGDDTAYALRAVIPGSKWVRPRDVVQARYYRAGLRLLDGIRNILAANTGANSESLAMVELYIADWHVLFDQEQSEAAYEYAFERLLEANVDATQLDQLFSKPQILPVPVFHHTVSDAVREGPADNSRQRADPSSTATNALSFPIWTDAMSDISSPTTEAGGPGDQAQQSEVLLRIRLNSLNKISRWINGRYRTNRGVAAEFEVINPGTEADFDLQSLDDRVRLLHFRPRIADGSVRPSEAYLLYRVALR